jgi:hypothetical protein
MCSLEINIHGIKLAYKKYSDCIIKEIIEQTFFIHRCRKPFKVSINRIMREQGNKRNEKNKEGRRTAISWVMVGYSGCWEGGGVGERERESWSDEKYVKPKDRENGKDTGRVEFKARDAQLKCHMLLEIEG